MCQRALMARYLTGSTVWRKWQWQNAEEHEMQSVMDKSSSHSSTPHTSRCTKVPCWTLIRSATLFGGNGSGRMPRNMHCSQKWTNARVHHRYRIHRDVPKSIDGALFDRQHC